MDWQILFTIVPSALLAALLVGLLLRYAWRMVFGFPPRRVVLMVDERQVKRILSALK